MTHEYRAAARRPGSLDELSTGSLAASQSHADAVTLPIPKANEEPITMTSLTTTTRQLTAASGLPADLNAAYDTFEWLLMAFRAWDDPACSTFAAFVMSAALAADGRDAIAFAPSLPPAALDAEIAAADGGKQSASELAGLCRDLVTNLQRLAETAPNPADGAACRDAARCAVGIHRLLTGGEP
jgi:hypothetical protein